LGKAIAFIVNDRAGILALMRTDEQAIRDLISNWLRATAAGDLNQLLSLMADDVVFLTAGQQPMRGRGAFAASFAQVVEQARIDARADVQEIRVSGDLAYCWNHLNVTVTSKAGDTLARRSGYTLTVLRREAAGEWVIFRDANLLTSAAH
jgi:uncharacterized protein (TIGR02246 family)